MSTKYLQLIGSNLDSQSNIVTLIVPTLAQGETEYTEEDKTSVKSAIDAIGEAKNPVVILNYNNDYISANYFYRNNLHYFTGLKTDNSMDENGETHLISVEYNTTDNTLVVRDNVPLIDSDEINSLKQQIADLMYRPIEFDWFSSTPSVKEIGSTATSVVLDWRINKTPSSLALSSTEIDENGTTIDMTIDNNAIDVTLDKPITKSATFTLSATDEKGTVTKTAQIDFVNGAYFGAVSADQTIDSNFLLTSHRIERSLTSLKSWGIWTQTFENEHVIFALPSSYTAPVFYADGIRGGFHLAQTFDFTNASGYTESYDVWLSDNTNLGVMMFDVDCKEG